MDIGKNNPALKSCIKQEQNPIRHQTKQKKKKKERKKSQEIKKSKACVKLFKNEEEIWLLGYSSLQR